jgi:hypothetical protein
MLPKISLPTIQQLHNAMRHNPKNTKEIKNHGPYLPCKRAMEKKMVNCLPSLLTHATPIQNQHVSSEDYQWSLFDPKEPSKQKRLHEGEPVISK